MPNQSNRPTCPKCGMSMIATSHIHNNKQAFECLRCNHAEMRKAEEPDPSR